MSFVAIDESRSLSDQGPFDIILQKVSSSYPFISANFSENLSLSSPLQLSGKTWRQNLEVSRSQS